MRTLRRTVSCILFVLLPSSTWAIDAFVGLNVHQFSYNEFLEPPAKSTEKALVYVPFAQVLFPIPALGQTFVKVEGEFGPTQTSTFDGTTLNTGQSVTDSDEVTFARAEADFYWEAVSNLFLYTGYGYRYWNRFLSGGAGYREIYTWSYWPVGILYQLPLNSQFTLGFDASYRNMQNGNLKVVFSETIINGEDTDLPLENRPGYKLQMPVRMTFPGTNYLASLTPWYEYSEIGGSDFKYNATQAKYIREPSSRTIQFGVAAGVGAAF